MNKDTYSKNFELQDRFARLLYFSCIVHSFAAHCSIQMFVDLPEFTVAQASYSGKVSNHAGSSPFSYVSRVGCLRCFFRLLLPAFHAPFLISCRRSGPAFCSISVRFLPCSSSLCWWSGCWRYTNMRKLSMQSAKSESDCTRRAAPRTFKLSGSLSLFDSALRNDLIVCRSLMPAASNGATPLAAADGADFDGIAAASETTSEQAVGHDEAF